MARQFFTADDVLQLARQEKSNVLLLGPEDVITLAAEELADKLGLTVIRESFGERFDTNHTPLTHSYTKVEILPPLKVVQGSQVNLDKFGLDPQALEANVHLKDVITSRDQAPVSAGYMTLDKGGFPWTLSYDEIDVILEGELVITRGSEVVRGSVGDVIFIPRGSSIVFSTPGKVRFVYVTYPADWNKTTG
jgi:ethanolamine utilization protein EutQ